MPRCDTCYRMLPKGDVRKLPGRDAFRCKEKFDCMLAADRKDPWTVTLAITYPAKDEVEAELIAADVQRTMKPLPLTIISVEPATL